jgi:hypothetical protein
VALLFDALGNVIGDDGEIPVDTSPPDTGFIARKTAEFQAALIDLSQNADTLQYLLTLDLSEENRAAVQAQLSDFESRRAAYKYTAETLNAVAGIANSMGASLPTVQVPSGLGFAVLGVPIAGLAVLAAVSGMLVYIATWTATTHSVALKAAEELEEPMRSEAMMYLATHQSSGMSGALSDTASAIKWIALAALAYFAYTAYNKGK